MHDRQIVLLTIFLTLVGALYIAAGAMLVAAAVRRLRRRAARPLSRRYVWARRIVFGLAAAGILLVAYSYFEPYWLEVTHVRIASAKLAPGSGPIRIAQISDLHCDPFPRLEERLPEVIAREKPDLIVFTGDALNSPAGLPIFKRCMASLSAIAPTFAVLGNWDANYRRTFDLFGGTGVKLLDGKTVKLRLHGAELWLGGAAYGRIGAATIFQGAPPNAVQVFLYHIPTGAAYAAHAQADLALAGHTHGGQVRVPFYGALAGFVGIEHKYIAGLYRVGGTWLYVNRGIGMEGGAFPRVRFRARPEVTIFDIVPQ
jgi:predicted MPP superfamily phosphohydrolase